MISDARNYRLPASFFAGNRKRLLGEIPKYSCVILFAGEKVCMSADSDYRFRVDSNFFYLSGIEQEDSVLLIRADEKEAVTTLFVHSNDPLKERWSGKRMTISEVMEKSGVDEVFFLETFEDTAATILADSACILVTDSGVRPGPASRFLERVKKDRGEEKILPIAPILARFRMVKQHCEIEMIRKAIELTDLSLREALILLREGTSETGLCSAINYAMSRRGCPEPAFPTIVAAGLNNFCLHHDEPEGDPIPPGVMIQIDAGATVGGLCADISRAYPSTGIFSDKQSALYEAVCACLKEIITMIRPGIRISDINRTFRDIAAEKLIELKIVDRQETGEANGYIWHNAAHHLGMDVHDACIKDRPIETNAVLAIEPGLYVREWGMGFRLEEDIRVTENGCEVLSSFIARDRFEVEDLLGMSGGMIPCRPD